MHQHGARGDSKPALLVTVSASPETSLCLHPDNGRTVHSREVPVLSHHRWQPTLVVSRGTGTKGRSQAGCPTFLLWLPQDTEHLGLRGVLAQCPQNVPTLSVRDLHLTLGRAVEQHEGLLELCGRRCELRMLPE